MDYCNYSSLTILQALQLELSVGCLGPLEVRELLGSRGGEEQGGEEVEVDGGEEGGPSGSPCLAIAPAES